MIESQYTVVTSDDFGEFEDRVNHLIEKGWRVQGGVATTPFPDNRPGLLHIQWSQAMVLPASAPVLDLEREQAAIPRAERDRGSRNPGDDQLSFEA